MQVRFSTDDLPPHERVRYWCNYCAKQVHNITPGEVADPAAFHAEAGGRIAGEFVLLDIESGLRRVRRTADDVARDKTEAFFVRRFRRPALWRAAPRSTPVDLSHEPGDFCVSSTEWQFDAEFEGYILIRDSGHPAVCPLASSDRGPTGAAVSNARRLTTRLAPQCSFGCGEGAGAASP